jgi:hypothetical protein
MGRHLLNAGNTVSVCNSRGPETLAEFVKALGPGAAAATKEEVVGQSDIVIIAVRWQQAQEALKGVDWNGRILVDAMNAHAELEGDISLEGVTKSREKLAGTGLTSSEWVAQWAPGARLVKSMSSVPMEYLEDFSADKPRTVFFTSGDDAEAKYQVIDMLNDAGFAGVNLGSLAVGGAMHEVGAPLSGLELHFARRMRPEARPNSAE